MPELDLPQAGVSQELWEQFYELKVVTMMSTLLALGEDERHAWIHAQQILDRIERHYE